MTSWWGRFALLVQTQKPTTTLTQTLEPLYTHSIMHLTLFLFVTPRPWRRRMLRSSLLWWAVCAWLCLCPSFHDSVESTGIGWRSLILILSGKLGEQCWLASNSGCEHGIYEPMCKERTFTRKVAPDSFWGHSNISKMWDVLAFFYSKALLSETYIRITGFLSGGYCIFTFQHF